MKPKHTLKHWLLASAMLAMPWAVDAAGLGKMTVTSALGQPLRAEIELIAVPKEDIDLLVAKAATPEDYKRAGLERPEGLFSVHFAVEKRAGGQPYLKVTSAQPFNEPFLQLMIQLDWPSGRLLRNYTLLLDPPGLMERPAAPAVTAPVVKSEAAKPMVAEPPKAESAVAPEKAVVEPKVKAAKAPVAKKAPATTAKAPPAKPDVLVRAEPAKPLTPAEQTFPRFDGAREIVAAPPAPVVAKPLESQKETYQVKSGDSLAKIAQNLKPEGYSLDQMLVSLFEANKQAFNGNNMNRLKSGQILRVPEKAELDAVAKGDAAKEVRAHAADWNAYRQKLGAATAEEKAAEPAGKQEAAGKITAKVEDKAPKAQEPAKDVLKLSKGEAADQAKGKAAAGGKPGAAGADTKALQDKLNAAQEEAAAKDKALKDANSRVADLEKNIQDMKRLLEAQNKQMADLQKQAGVKPAAEPVKPAPAAEAKPPEAAVVPPPAEKAPPLVAAIPETKPAEAAPQKPAKPKVTARPVEPVSEPSFMDDLLSNPLYLAGGGAVVVGGLLTALWAVGRRRKKSLASFEDSIMTGGDLKANTVFGNTGGGQIDTGDTSFLTDFSQAGMGAIDTNDVDPIAEAEVYMAYGRDAQAEEILKEAMNKDPNRHEVQLKLLEIYAGRRNQDAFETLASELYAATSGQGPVWEKAAEMGRTLDPENPLYAKGGAGAAAAVAAGAAAAAAASAAAPAAPLDFSLDLDTGGGMSPLDQATVPGDMAIDTALDFNLDTAAAPEASSTEELSMGSAENAPLEFDLGNIIPQALEKQADVPAEHAPGGDLSFDLPDLGDLGTEESPADVTPSEADTLSDLDFNFDLEAPSSAAQPAAPAETEPLMPDLNLSGIDLDVGAGAMEGVSLEEATTLAGAPGGAWEEASTKLDLARAYVEMGDKDGAREILEEVMHEGGPEQQAEAKSLLASLS